MATLALSVAGQVAGGLVGGPIGATIGRALGALAGGAIDQALFGEEAEQQTPSDVRLQGSTEGGAIPRIYGWNRLAGNIIWATQLERALDATAGGKGFGGEESEELLANFAVGLCEGEVSHVGRIWADGRLLETAGLNMRVYKGTASQSADPLIAAKQGADNAPAYRGLCYIVFESLALSPFGNRIPNISVEICRAVGELENQIRAVTVIPGATEFGYDPEPRVQLVSPGVTALENTHLLGQTSDWTLSIDELQALCPNLKNVALVVAWFGDDLRCGSCAIQPRVEGSTRVIADTEWVVSGQARANVPVVSSHDGGPAYGGTPSDAAVLAAIADLKARGLNVTLYPIILMDVPADNVLTDPYTGGAGQAAYPWRGRITCNPGPGQAGSPDQSVAVNTQIANFNGDADVGDFSAGINSVNFADGADWGYRRMFLHYAHLAEMAGGVDAILIGSEMREMTFLRDEADGFPFVDALIQLAADMRSVVGEATRITYAADWSEYAGFQPPEAPGDKYFHLDPLWASDDLDAVGIDNYMPLSDWRGAGLGPDAGVAASPYQLDYLGKNITGGEGYEWYYSSQSDRLSGTRTPIADEAHDEPWVWRFKDIRNWWQNAHYNRIGGARQASATGWVPQSKPIWLTELGCAAIDKGTNQPNIFGDPKSAENGRPYFSDGTPDALIQRQFLRAHHRHWQPDAPGFDAAHNPTSSIYDAPMLDPDRLYCWTWDARPFPAFPQQTEVWADGPNHAIGHWLTGRLGAAASDEFITAMARDYGVKVGATSACAIAVSGVQVGTVTSMRSASDPILQAAGMIVRDALDGLDFIARHEGDKFNIEQDRCVRADGTVLSRTRNNVDETPGQLSLTYLDHANEYQVASAVAISGANTQKTTQASNLVLDADASRLAAENLLRQMSPRETVSLQLPASVQRLDVGDRLHVDTLNDGPYIVETLRQGDAIEVTARLCRDQVASSFSSTPRVTPPSVPGVGAAPVIVAAHLPNGGGDIDPTQLVFGSFAAPWPGDVQVRMETGTEIARLTSAATLGVLTSDLHAATPVLWDRRNIMSVALYNGHISSLPELDVLSGMNRMAVEHDDGAWEIVGFANAELDGAATYNLSNLLRARDGTDHTLITAASAGNRVMLLNRAVARAPVSSGDLADDISLRAYAGRHDTLGVNLTVNLNTGPALPLAPAALYAFRQSGASDIEVTWKRRTRLKGDGWSLSNVPLDYTPELYRVSIKNGQETVRRVDVNNSSFVYTAAMQSADFGGPAENFDFTVQQVSAALGPGHAASGDFYG